MIECGHDFRYLAYCDYYSIVENYGSCLGLIGIFEKEEDAIKAIEYTKDSIKMAVGSAGAAEELDWRERDYDRFKRMINSTNYYDPDNEDQFAPFKIKKVELNRRYWFGVPQNSSWFYIEPEIDLGGYAE